MIISQGTMICNNKQSPGWAKIRWWSMPTDAYDIYLRPNANYCCYTPRYETLGLDHGCIIIFFLLPTGIYYRWNRSDIHSNAPVACINGPDSCSGLLRHTQSQLLCLGAPCRSISARSRRMLQHIVTTVTTHGAVVCNQQSPGCAKVSKIIDVDWCVWHIPTTKR